LVVRRLEREIKPVKRYISFDFYSSFVLTTIDDDPKSVGEVVDSTKGKLWKDSMVKEMEYFNKNGTWDLVKLTNGRNIIGSK